MLALGWYQFDSTHYVRIRPTEARPQAYPALLVGAVLLRTRCAEALDDFVAVGAGGGFDGGFVEG